MPTAVPFLLVSQKYLRVLYINTVNLDFQSFNLLNKGCWVKFTRNFHAKQIYFTRKNYSLSIGESKSKMYPFFFGGRLLC